MSKPRMTIEQFRALAEKRSSNCSPKKTSKYKAVKTNGYDSKREYTRAQKLKLLEQAGEIFDLREQVPFVLIPSQRNAEGYMERACKYVADFVYIDKQGEMVVEDSKGVRTDVYKIKRKLMLMVHGITIKEV